MANTRELRRRIKSVKNTAQITKAMQMVAATKMRRAQNQALSGRPYSETLNNSLSNLLPKVEPESHPLLTSNGVVQTGVVLLSTNKALCGALNTNLFREVQGFMSGNKTSRHSERSEESLANASITGTSPEIPRSSRNDNFRIFSVGLKARNFAVSNNFTLEADFENTEVVMFARAKKIANLLIQAYLEKVIGEVYLVYPHFVSTLKQEPRIVKLLPISVIPGDKPGIQNNKELDSRLRGNDNMTEYLFEPNANQLLDFVLTHQIETQIYQALLEAKASEHSARMMAMQNATDNARELVEELNLTYNKTRQDAITAELLEITSAGLALE